jgi:RNA polymerase sigma factor (sigma-70 family)
MTSKTPENKKSAFMKPDLALVEEALGGDMNSFTELCRRYYPAMVAIAHSILDDRDLAEDAAQQTFANAVRKLSRLKKRDQFASWLAAICRNAAKDMARMRRIKLYNNEDLASVAAESYQDDTKNEGVETVREAINNLSASAREVIFLRYYDGLSYEQVSAVLGISEQAINGRLRRAKKKMADYLRRNGFDEVRL